MIPHITGMIVQYVDMMETQLKAKVEKSNKRFGMLIESNHNAVYQTQFENSQNAIKPQKNSST